MNFRKIFEIADKKGLNPFEIRYSSSSQLSITLFQDQIDNYTSSTNSSLTARGIYEGKVGTFSSDRIDSKTFEFIVDHVLDNARYGIKGDPEFFIEKGLKYKKVKNYYKELENVTPDKLLSIGKQIYELCKQSDKRVDVVQTEIALAKSDAIMQNSKGLNLKEKANLLTISTVIQAKSGEEIQSGFDLEFITDLDKFDVQSYVKRVIKKTMDQFGGIEIESGKYNIILNNETSAALVSAIMDHVSSYQVKNKLSLFEGKVNQKVLSSKVTILDNPLKKTVFASSFDGEGSPCQVNTIIKKGVLQTYIYDLENAKEFKTKTTGNGHLSGGKIIPSMNFIEVKKGKLSFDQLLQKVGNGIYVTSLEGLGTGLNGGSLNYSLQASGYVIKEGKIDKPISLMTVAGNVLKDFNRVIGVGADEKVTYYGISSPSIAIRKVSISGK